MQKIIVVGTTSSGKSRLAAKIAAKLNIHHIQLDSLFWKANWGETPDAEFFEKIKKEIAHDQWVIDGNYTRTRHITWKEADTIIWIDLPFWLTFYQNVSRSVQRAITQKELWEGTGNKESFAKMFSSDSIILWLLKTYHANIKKYEKDMSDPQYSHLKFIRLRSRREVEQFVSQLP